MTSDAGSTALSVSTLRAGFGAAEILKGIHLSIRAQQVTAIIGPSGCGKSTFIRTLNRMHETSGEAWVKGTVMLDGQDIYAPEVDPVLLRRRRSVGSRLLISSLWPLLEMPSTTSTSVIIPRSP